MIKAFSQKLLPPFSGQVQIAESDTYRAITLDGQFWEIQYVRRSHIRVGTLTAKDIKTRSINSEKLIEDVADPKLIVLLDYLSDVTLPFEGIDCFEYWLLDRNDNAPIALIYSCSQELQKSKFPERAEWTALPDAVMPIVKTEQELASQDPPVNYRLEGLIAERAGTNAKAMWFDRRESDNIVFPPFLIATDWPDSKHQSLVQRYIDRQAPRLMMIQGLTLAERERLELSCKPYATEVSRFCAMYPQIVNEEMIRTLRVEARLREISNPGGESGVHNRRDGILYM